MVRRPWKADFTKVRLSSLKVPACDASQEVSFNVLRRTRSLFQSIATSFRHGFTTTPAPRVPTSSCPVP
eukprot:2082670-Amphidinium_carterae.1